MKPYSFSLPIAVARHTSGLPLLYPLFKLDWVRLEGTPEALLPALSQSLENDVLRKGYYQELLYLDWGSTPQHERFTTTLQASEKGLYPELELDFDLMLTSVRGGYWVGIIPALGLQTSAPSPEVLREAVQDLVRLEMMRHQRLDSLSALIQTQWTEVVDVRALPLQVPIYTLKELKDIENQPGASLVEQVAQAWHPEAIEVYGLDEAKDRAIKSLRQAQRQSLLVTGTTGRGKTALLQHLVSHREALGLPPVKVWEATAAQLLQGLTQRGGWQGQLQKLCKELQSSGDWLYIPDFTEMFEVGQYAGNAQSMADFLRPMLMRGEIVILTECTPAGLAAMERRAPGYASLFVGIELPEQSSEALLHVIQARGEDLARAQNISLSEAATRETLRLMQWFTPYAGLPGKAIRFLQAALQETVRQGRAQLDVKAVYEQFCQETGLPSSIIDPQAPLEIAEVEAFFQRNIFGQQKAIATVIDLLVSIKAAVVRRGKPLGSLLFVGPTGVGKTELAKVLARYLFGSRDQMIRFDMSEYQDLPALLRLTGDDGRGEGLLTAAVRQRPFSVVLFDELEKVNPLFYDMLLQILGEGRLTSSTGRVADFSSTLIIMTSNLGAKDYQSGGVGYTTGKQDLEARATEHFTQAVQAHFRPELFNRLDRIVPFAPLGPEVMQAIVLREMKLIEEREGLRSRVIHWNIDEAVYGFLSQGGYHPEYGARYLQRFLQQHWVAPLAHRLFKYRPAQPLRIHVAVAPTAQGLTFELQEWKEAETMEQVNLSREHTLLHLTGLRRELQNVNLGPVYVKFGNRLTTLRHTEKVFRKNGKIEKFWSRPDSVWYAEALEQELQYQKLLVEITELEEATLLALFDAQQTPWPKENIQRWEKTWEAWGRRLLKLQFPHWESCYLGIYGQGRRLAKLVHTYLTLAQAEGFRVSGEYLWYDAEKATEKKPYQVGLLNFGEEHPLPKNAIGVQLSINGDMAYLFFNGEDGFYHYEDEEESAYFMVKTASPGPLATPEALYRRKFFRDKKFRRTYQGNTVKGEREYPTPHPEGELLPVLQGWLRHRFQRLIKKVLLEGEE